MNTHTMQTMQQMRNGIGTYVGVDFVGFNTRYTSGEVMIEQRGATFCRERLFIYSCDFVASSAQRFSLLVASLLASRCHFSF